MPSKFIETGNNFQIPYAASVNFYNDSLFTHKIFSFMFDSLFEGIRVYIKQQVRVCLTTQPKQRTLSQVVVKELSIATMSKRVTVGFSIKAVK